MKRNKNETENWLERDEVAQMKIAISTERNTSMMNTTIPVAINDLESSRIVLIFNEFDVIIFVRIWKWKSFLRTPNNKPHGRN